MSGPRAASPELELAYDQAHWAPNMQKILARYAVLSERTRSAVGGPQRLSYGSGPHEMLDLYKAGKRAPAVIFVHGGAWRNGLAKDYAFPAEMLLGAGISFIALDFSAVTDTGGELGILVDQVRRAVAWIFQNCAALGIDARRIFIMGHSSGAHLAATTLSTDWAEYEISANPIKGGVLISGIYDLAPLRQISRGDYIRIDDNVERELSPLHRVSFVKSPLLLAAGSSDSPEFLRQARTYANAARAAGKSVMLTVGQGYNHFEVLETLAAPAGFLGRGLLDFIEADA